MTFRMAHMNINVMDLDKAEAFYKEALNMEVVRIKKAEDGRYELRFMEDEFKHFQLELTWLRDRTEPYDLSDNEIHLAFHTDDYDGALAKHKAMDCVAFENKEMSVYFIEDPDGYWVEIVPAKRD